MCELLIRAIDNTNEDPDLDRQCYKKGDVVVIMPDGWQWGTGEALPGFVVVKVPGVSVASAENYMSEWRRL